MEIFQMENVIELEKQRQNRKLDAPNRDVLESMYAGVAMSKWGSLENLATEVADLAPLQFLKILSRFVEPPTNNEK
jgi:hypothetical protein